MMNIRLIRTITTVAYLVTDIFYTRWGLSIRPICLNRCSMFWLGIVMEKAEQKRLGIKRPLFSFREIAPGRA